MPSVTLHSGDNRLSLRRLIDQGVRVHSVVTDPPYGLVSIQKRFGKEGSAPARKEKNDGSFARLSGGFMGKQWDATGIERDPEFWKLIYDILLPGGYVFAFSGSRTGHWQACAMEMAGFIMHPMHGWCFGSGFPKAHAADKAIDKALGARGVYGGVKLGHGDFVGRKTKGHIDFKGATDGFDRPWMHDEDARSRYHMQYTPSTPEAAEWEGYAYGTQAQKPALEPIYLGQKPFDCKTGAANLLKHGVGAVNIDGCRVGGDGRHPANLLLDGSTEVVDMFPASAGAAAPVKGTEKSSAHKNTYNARDRVEGAFHGDSGSAARFFHHFPPDTQPLIYNSKAAKADRGGSNHPTVKPIALMQYLVRHITPPGGTVLDPFAGTGTTGEAAKREGMNCILMEAEAEYIEFLEKRFDIAQPVSDFDDILGPTVPVESTESGEFNDVLGF